MTIYESHNIVGSEPGLIVTKNSQAKSCDTTATADTALVDTPGDYSITVSEIVLGADPYFKDHFIEEATAINSEGVLDAIPKSTPVDNAFLEQDPFSETSLKKTPKAPSKISTEDFNDAYDTAASIEEDNNCSYESDYEYEDDDGNDIVNLDSSDQENRKIESFKKPKVLQHESRDISIDSLRVPSCVQLVASLPSAPSVIMTLSNDPSNSFCSVCQNQEVHTPVLDCSLLQIWNRLVDERGNGIVDVAPCLIPYAMRGRVEQCYGYVHNVLRSGWPRPAFNASLPAVGSDVSNQHLEDLVPALNVGVNQSSGNRHSRLQPSTGARPNARTDRFFAHKTREAVAADLRAFRWDIQAWRNAMRARLNLERAWRAAAQRTEDGLPPYDLWHVQREIADLGLDSMIFLALENEGAENRNGVQAARSDSYQQARHEILEDHESFLHTTIPGNEESADRNYRDGSRTESNPNNGNAVAGTNDNAAEETRIQHLSRILQRRSNCGNNLSNGAKRGALLGFCRGIHGPESWSPVVTQARTSGLNPTAAAVDGMYTRNDLNQEESWTCPICLDDEVEVVDRICVRFPSPYRPSNQSEYDLCGHYYCRDCWLNYTRGWLEDVKGSGGGNLTSRFYCPHPQCFAQVTRDHVVRITGSERSWEVTLPSQLHPILKLYDELALNSFVEGHRRTICWCPGPNCDRIMVQCDPSLFVQTPDRQSFGMRNGVFTCCSSCKTKFCFRCGNSPEEHQGALWCPELIPVEDDIVVARRENNDLGDSLPAANAAVRLNARMPTAADNEDINYGKIRRCPICKIPIEKNGGCAHMRCKCGHHFCWLCMADMKQDMGHFCGREGAGDILLNHRRVHREPNHRRAHRAEANPTVFNLVQVDMDYLVDELRISAQSSEGLPAEVSKLYQDFMKRHKDFCRFVHYYNRFVFHSQGQQFAGNQCECIASRASTYSYFSKIKSAADTDFFLAANERLVISRRILKFSYCLLYFKLEHTPSEFKSDVGDSGVVEDAGCPADNALSASLPVPLALFLDHQERLERMTEQLSFLSENATTPSDRRRVMDMIQTVDKCIQAVTALSFEQCF